MKLSIGICSIPIRINQYRDLVDNLNNQIANCDAQEEVEIISFTDCKTISVGHKRNIIKSIATGDYFCFIDDDDRVSEDYIESILEAVKSGADVITFKGEYSDVNGVIDFHISTMYGNKNEPKMYYRIPNHISPVKRSIYTNCDFTDKNYQEDSDYSFCINKFIKNEYHIAKKLYFYDFDEVGTQTHPSSKNTAFIIKNK
jgi:glycosyltransferase involved in cell wall biosynthesis